MPGPRTRRTPRLRLGTTSARTQPILEDPPFLPPVLIAIGGGLASVLAGALLVGALVLVGWWGAVSVSVPGMLATIGGVWILGNGGPLVVGGLRITLLPLGLTAVFAGLCAATAAFSFQQATRARPRPARQRGRSRWILVAVQLAFGYAIGTTVIALALGVPVLAVLPGAIGVALSGGLLGAWWRSGHRLPVPVWLRSAGLGALAGLGTLAVFAAVALAVALVQGEPRIATLEQELGLDAAGTVVWAVIGLLYLPTLLGWVAAWLLGAGFSLGEGSLVAPWATQLGLLPSVPVFGALPADGVGGLEPWLVTGVLAGLVAGGTAAAAAARHGGEKLGVVGVLASGSLAGLLAGCGFLAWAALSRGALGGDRFATVGPIFPESLIGVGTLTFAAAVGAVLAGVWLVRRVR
jgi:hypothetical protein